MRFLLENSNLNNSNPFLLNEFLGILGEEIVKSYDWIFSDMDSYVIKEGEEIENSIFLEENFLLSGKELNNYLKEFEVLIVFGLILAVEKKSFNPDKDNFPDFLHKENFLENDFVSPINKQIMEFAFYDSSFIIFSSKLSAAESKIKINYPEYSIFSLDKIK